jgi:hypothetical protein
LKDKDKIADFLKSYKPNTQRNFLITICASLNGEKTYKKLYKHYYDELMKMNKSLKKEEASNIKTETQDKNWIEWDDVIAKYEELYKKATNIKQIKSRADYDAYLDAITLGLYVDIPPRRNEYGSLIIEDTDTPLGVEPVNKIKGDKLILQHFKTAKKEGTKTIDIPEKLSSLIKSFVKKRENKSLPNYLYVDYDGKRLGSVNAITRILNRIFKKNIGSSMLRHIYLSSKYGKVQNEMKEDADAMSHSTTTQKDYIKGATPNLLEKG